MAWAAIALAGILLLAATAANLSAAWGARDFGRKPATNEHRLESLLGQNSHARKIETRDSAGVKKIIGADEICNKVFRDGDVSFEMYIAYWRAGSGELSQSYSHIPDMCWSLSGWKCDDGISAKSYNFAGQKFRPAEWRRFSAVNQHQDVIYWCLVGKKLFPYYYNAEKVEHDVGRITAQIHPTKRQITFTSFFGESEFLFYWNAKLHRVNTGNDLLRNPTILDDTYFIRINSSHPMETLALNAMFQEQMAKLARLGLAAR